MQYSNEIAANPSVTSLTLVKCNLDELKLPSWITTLVLENYGNLNLASPNWFNVTRLEIRNANQLYGFTNETFALMSNLKEIVIDNAEINVRGSLIWFHQKPLSLVQLDNTKILKSEGSLTIYANNVNVSLSEWHLLRMNVSIYGSFISVDANNISSLPVGSLRLEAAELNIQGNAFKLIEASGIRIKGNVITVQDNKFDVIKGANFGAIHLTVPAEDFKLSMSNNKWSDKLGTNSVLDVDGDWPAARKGFFPDDEEYPHQRLGEDEHPNTGQSKNRRRPQLDSDHPTDVPCAGHQHSSARKMPTDILATVILTFIAIFMNRETI